MRMSRLSIVMLVAGPFLVCGCKDFRWDWWNKPKQDLAARNDDMAGAADQDLLDEVERDLNPQPTMSSRPSTGPTDRKQWSKPSKTPTTKSSRFRGPIGGSVETPILMVNGEPITIDEVLDPIRKDLEEAVKTSSIRQYRQMLMERSRRGTSLLIDEVLAYGEAKKEITDEMDGAIVKAIDDTERNRITSEFGGRLSRYQAHLEEHGLKREEVRHRIRRNLVVKQFLRDKFLPLIRPPTRKELSRYYKKNPGEFAEPLRIEMFLIDVPYARFLKGATGREGQTVWAKVRGPKRIEARRAAVRRMEQARQELASGIPFAAVAKSYSFGPNKSKGGEWGPVSPEGLTGRWAGAAEVLAKLEPGQISDVLRTDDGLLLVRAGKRYDDRVIPFAEAQPIIEKRILRQQQKRMEDKLIFKLRGKATMPTRESLSAFFAAVFSAAPRHPDDKPDFKLE